MAVQLVGNMRPMVVTTDNTNTDICIVEIPASSLCVLYATVMGKGTADASVCVVDLAYVFKRDGTGDAAFVGTLWNPQIDNVAATWFADADASGTGIHIYVNGAAATNIEWWCEARIVVLQLTSAMS